MTKQQKAIIMVAQALLETVVEAGSDGAPSGPMYAAVNAAGIDLATYESIMRGLVNSGRIIKRGHVYYRVQT